MRGMDRRTLLRAAAAALLLPIAGAASERAMASSGARFVPPAGPMLYTRRLERGLKDGASIVVSRSFSVVFQRQGDGYRVEGRQVGVDVSAPDALAEFARIERERKEPGVFPLILGPSGLIQGTDGPRSSSTVEAALREATSRIRAREMAPADKDALQQFILAIHQSAGKLVSELPADLFAPIQPERRESREVALPDGEAGEVTVLFTAQADPVTGLMREAVREVVTALGSDQRRTVESWQLAPL